MTINDNTTACASPNDVLNEMLPIIEGISSSCSDIASLTEKLIACNEAQTTATQKPALPDTYEQMLYERFSADGKTLDMFTEDLSYELALVLFDANVARDQVMKIHEKVRRAVDNLIDQYDYPSYDEWIAESGKTDVKTDVSAWFLADSDTDDAPKDTSHVDDVRDSQLRRLAGIPSRSKKEPSATEPDVGSDAKPWNDISTSDWHNASTVYVPEPPVLLETESSDDIIAYGPIDDTGAGNDDHKGIHPDITPSSRPKTTNAPLIVPISTDVTEGIEGLPTHEDDEAEIDRIIGAIEPSAPDHYKVLSETKFVPASTGKSNKKAKKGAKTPSDDADKDKARASDDDDDPNASQPFSLPTQKRSSKRERR